VHPETFLTPQTQAYLFVTLRADDPLMAGVVRAAVMAEPGGRAVKTKSGESADQEQVMDLIGKATPIQLVLILETGDEGLLPGFVVSVHRYAPLVLALVRAGMAEGAESGDGALTEYGGARIYRTNAGTTAVVRGNNLGIAQGPDTGRIWVDRLLEQRKLEERAGADAVPVPGIPAREELSRAHARLDRSVAVRFAAVNTGPEAAWLMSVLPEGPVREALVQAGAGSRSIVSIAGQIESLDADSGGLELLIECTDATAAEKIRTAVSGLGATQSEDAALGDVAARVQDGNVVAVSAVVDDLPRKVVALLHYLQEKGEEAESQPTLTPPSP
jgi:hypothetical protein